MKPGFLDEFGPVHCPSLSLEAAHRYCEKLARSHYENFTVGSWFLPRSIRRHAYHVYAYCRWSDDLADEIGDRNRSLELLEWWNQELEACFQGHPRHPVFVALQETIEQFDIPIHPFSDLLSAFVQDQHTGRYATFPDVLDYCTRSANPVGRLVLYLFGYRDPERQALSDFTCTALQLANFWQDVARDLDKDRVYVPLEDLEHFGVTQEQLFRRQFTPEYAEMMRFQVERTQAMFQQGMPLCSQVAPRLRLDLELFSQGGLEILRLIEKAGWDTLSQRPALSRRQKAGLIARRFLAGLARPGAGP